MAIAALWAKLGQRGQQMLRGREFTFLGRQWHIVSVITGALIIAVGILFWSTNGLVSMPELVPMDTQIWLQEATFSLGSPLFDIALIIVAAGLFLYFWNKRQKRKEEAQRPKESGWVINPR